MTVVQFRRFQPEDSAAVRRLHEWAMREAGTDPDDIPGTADLQDIERCYLDVGGDFLVGISPKQIEELSTTDGSVVAMGGFLPCGEGHADERSVPGGAELHRMRVAPRYQGKGYGRMLLDELEQHIRAAGFDPILATTAARQQRAVWLYRSARYQEVKRSAFGEYELVHFEKQIGSTDER